MRSVAVIIMSFFAAIWWAWGISNTAWILPAPMAVGVVISLGLIALAVQTDRGATPLPETDQRRIGRLVGWASAIEGVTIFAAANVTNWLGVGAYFICVTAIIVGLHFIPLARMPHARIYNVTAAVLVGIGLAGCLLPWPLRGAVTGIAAALAIWATCAIVIAAPHQACAKRAVA